MNELKFSFLNYLNHFGFYDYIAFTWLILTFFMLLFLSFIVIKKSIKLSLITILFSFIFLFIGPFILKYFLNHTIRPVKISHIKVQKLHFSNTIIVDFSLKNLSKKPYGECNIATKIYKPTKSKLKEIINKLKPIRDRTILYKNKIKAGEEMKKRVVFYNFNNNADINISVNAECYGISK